MDIADEKQEYNHKEKSHVFETIVKPDAHLNEKEEKHMYRKVSLQYPRSLLVLISAID